MPHTCGGGPARTKEEWPDVYPLLKAGLLGRLTEAALSGILRSRNPIASRLTRKARSIAEDEAVEAAELEREIAQLKDQLALLETRARVGRVAMRRLEHYQPYADAAYRCPWCWIEFERRQRLDLSDDGPDALDPRSDRHLSCLFCGSQWAVPPGPDPLPRENMEGPSPDRRP
jgi:hypothetical protein